MQGGPLMHIIAAKAHCFIEALDPAFNHYIKQVLINTKACANEMARLGAKVSDTETHLFLVDTKASFGLTGLEAQNMVEEIGITLNKNMIPGDQEKPSVTSGVRIGLAATTTRGLTENGAKQLGNVLFGYLSGKIPQADAIKITKQLVAKLIPVDQI